MKRLITIFISSIIGAALWGQEQVTLPLPMTVVGDVYVASNAQMKSEGTVHLLAVSGDKVANVANYGTLTMDSVIFYSNDSIEGLLMNQKDGSTYPTLTVPGNGVAVRKVFSKNNAWYQISFPFDVKLNEGIVNPLTGKPLKYEITNTPNSTNSDLYIQYYSTQKRAIVGMNVDTIWQTLPRGTTELKKGVGYRIAVLLSHLSVDYPVSIDTVGAYTGRFSVDFFADNSVTTPTNIRDLFAVQSKGVSLEYYPASFLIAPENSEGWNAIGGLNSTNYLLNGSTVNFLDPIYAWTDATQWGYPIYPADYTEPNGTLRPYAVFFVQATSSTVLNYDGNNSGGFSFKGDGSGLVLAADPTLPIFRSSTASSYDMFKVQLTGVKNDFTSRVYFKFNDSYTQTFNTSEGDRVLLQATMPSLQSVWAVVPNENSTKDQAFINCLPYDESEVPLGVNIPVAGEYIFSLKNIAVDKGISSVVLMDNTTGIETDLLKSDYNIQVTAAINSESRFALFINKTITSIDQVTGPDIYAYAENNVITVKNLNSEDKVQVLDLTGRIIASGIASGNTYSTTVNQKGVYIVNVRGGAKILKVLNK